VRFDVLTLFPELFDAHLRLGVTRRAYESGRVEVRLWPLRDFGEGAHQRIDERPFGGGPGMVMQAPVLSKAVAAVRAQRQAERAGPPPGRSQGGPAPSVGSERSERGGTGPPAGRSQGGPAPSGDSERSERGGSSVPLVLLSPTGRRLDQACVRELAAGPGAIVLCGRYEGVDQRFIDREVDVELSLGDFVLSGGEIAALALLDAVARLQDDVLGNAQSHRQDSFGADGLLDCPHYTQPALWDGLEVPAVLASGHHAQIGRWRREQSLALTRSRRPDLIDAARARGDLDAADEAFLHRAPLPPGAGWP
jgi:tRNA (guanine37-N1)-methyltransferase